MQFVSLHPWQFGFELTEILLGERKADGWVGGFSSKRLKSVGGCGKKIFYF